MHIPDSWSPRSPGGPPHAYIRQLEAQVSWRAASCTYPTAGAPGLQAGRLMHISDIWHPRSPGGPPQAYIQSLSVAATGPKRTLSYPICTRPAQLLVSLSVPPHIPSSSTTGIHQCTAPHIYHIPTSSTPQHPSASCFKVGIARRKVFFPTLQCGVVRFQREIRSSFLLPPPPSSP